MHVLIMRIDIISFVDSIEIEVLSLVNGLNPNTIFKIFDLIKSRFSLI